MSRRRLPAWMPLLHGAALVALYVLAARASGSWLFWGSGVWW